MEIVDESPLLESSSSASDPSVHKVLCAEETPAGNSKCAAMGYFLFQTMSWLPLVLSLAGSGLIAYTAAFVAAWFNVLFLSFVWDEMALQIIFIIVNGILTILAWIHRDDMTNVNAFSHTIICGGLVIGINVAWSLGFPFMKAHIADSVNEEEISHPILRHKIRRLTGMWNLTFSLMALIAIIPPIIRLQGGASSTVNAICPVLVYIVFFLGLCMSYWIYPTYFVKHKDEISDLYLEEIAAWNKEHRDHEYAQKDEEDGEVDKVCWRSPDEISA